MTLVTAASGFQLVVDDDDLDIAAAHLAAEIFHCKRKAVPNLLAKRGGRPRQGHDHTQFDFVLGKGRGHHGPEQHGGCGQGHLRLHDLSLVTIGLRCKPRTPNSNLCR
ncbi:hypothetical protein ACVME9_007250 [Bradyrhizobium liaoningense]